MCEIKLYIGDNASGKTRQSIRDAIGHEYEIGTRINGLITNIPYILTNQVTDKHRKEIIEESLFNYMLETYIEKIGYNPEVEEAKDLLKLLYQTGDVLLLDEIDTKINEGYTGAFLKAIYDNRDLWKKVIINGHSHILLRVFGDGKKNILYIDNIGNIIQLKEKDAYEYLN